jgi:protein-cysteine N-palmitoyltransferase HHAT
MAIFSILLIIGLHGASSLKVFGILAVNYLLAKRLGGERLGPLILWVVNLAILFANELNDGYRFGSLHSSLAYLVRTWSNLNA